MKKDKLIKIMLSLVLVLFLVISIIFPIFNLFIKAFQGKNGNYIGLKTLLNISATQLQQVLLLTV